MNIADHNHNWLTIEVRATEAEIVERSIMLFLLIAVYLLLVFVIGNIHFWWKKRKIMQSFIEKD